MSRRVRFALLSLVVLTAVVVVGSAAAIRFTDESCSNETGCRPPTGLVGVSYLHTVQIAPGGGTAPYSYVVIAGSLPPGLGLNSGNGQITGKPTQAGAFTFFIDGGDACPDASQCVDSGNPSPPCTNANQPIVGGTCRFPHASTQRDFTITVDPGLSINQNSVPAGTIGSAYSQQLTATLVTALPPPAGSPLASNATWSVASGTLPPGVTLSATGLLSGTPTTEGSYTFVVRAELDPSRFDTETETLVVRQALTVSGQAPARSEVGVRYSAQLTASGGTGTFTWSLAGGSLPTGVTLAPSGSIAGTPRASGRFPFTAKVTDTENRTTSVDAAIVVSPRLTVTTAALRLAKVGRLYRAKLAATGGVIPKVWKVTKGPLPRGVRLDRKTGILSGTPRKAGTYRIRVQITDGFKVTSTRALRITVLPAAKH